LDAAQRYLDKARNTLVQLEQQGFVSQLEIALKIEIEVS